MNSSAAAVSHLHQLASGISLTIVRQCCDHKCTLPAPLPLSRHSTSTKATHASCPTQDDIFHTQGFVSSQADVLSEVGSDLYSSASTDFLCDLSSSPAVPANLFCDISSSPAMPVYSNFDPLVPPLQADFLFTLSCCSAATADLPCSLPSSLVAQGPPNVYCDAFSSPVLAHEGFDPFSSALPAKFLYDLYSSPLLAENRVEPFSPAVSTNFLHDIFSSPAGSTESDYGLPSAPLRTII
jgi:hypothetical protein